VGSCSKLFFVDEMKSGVVVLVDVAVKSWCDVVRKVDILDVPPAAVCELDIVGVSSAVVCELNIVEVSSAVVRE
jgi:hypothetical protein